MTAHIAPSADPLVGPKRASGPRGPARRAEAPLRPGRRPEAQAGGRGWCSLDRMSPSRARAPRVAADRGRPGWGVRGRLRRRPKPAGPTVPRATAPDARVGAGATSHAFGPFVLVREDAVLWQGFPVCRAVSLGMNRPWKLTIYNRYLTSVPLWDATFEPLRQAPAAKRLPPAQGPAASPARSRSCRPPCRAPRGLTGPLSCRRSKRWRRSRSSCPICRSQRQE